MPELMGAILVGGLSTRMGRDKATLRLHDGRRMLDAVAEALRAVCDDIVTVGSGDRQPPGFPRISDLRPHAGPLGGLEALLASSLAREYLVCPCDVPGITPQVLRLLLQRRDAAATVLRLVERDDFEPLPTRLAATALPTVQRLLDAGQRSILGLMNALPAAIVEVESQHAAALRNVNTPDDLSRA